MAAWSESAFHKDLDPYKDRSRRKVEINIGGEHIGQGEFKGGHTYSGKLADDEVRLVLSLLNKLAERNRQ